MRRTLGSSRILGWPEAEPPRTRKTAGSTAVSHIRGGAVGYRRGPAGPFHLAHLSLSSLAIGSEIS